MKRKQFTFYRSYYDAAMTLSPKEREGFLSALAAYALDGTEPEGLSRVQQAMFILCKPTADSGRRKSMGGGHPAEKVCKEGEKEKEKEKKKEKEKETETEGSAAADREMRAFERFWQLYPVKVDKEGAAQAWQATAPESGVVMEGLKGWMDSSQWEAEGGRYVPRAAKFLREKHYLAAPERLPAGVRGELGQAELEAIRKLLEA